MFELNQVRCFLAVAEELHFGRAAERLNMTQPPLSRQIQILEHLLDATLFERTSRSVRLTPAGRTFLLEARRILRLAEGAAVATRRVAAGKAGAIHLGFTAASAYSCLPALVAACRDRLPDVDLLLHEMVSRDQAEALGAGQIDLALLRPPILLAGARSFLVATEPLVAAIPQDSPLAAREAITIHDFVDHPFIMYSPFEARYFHDLVAELFAGAGARPREAQHLAQVHSVLALVSAGLGLAITPRASAKLQYDGVAFRPLIEQPSRPVELHLAWRADTDNPLVPILVDLAQDLVAQKMIQ